uniref:C-type lectin domain-containing protein n=1 Tax=Pelodiscus sinensis TaxID=13735 RepID=K7G4L4_PELSI
ACCPEKWIGYYGKCYFIMCRKRWGGGLLTGFSKGLCVIQGENIREFLMQYKGYLDAWLGVTREPAQPWKWPNGTIFSRPVQVGGGGECMCIFEKTISSSRCYTKRNWICSKPDELA